MNTVENPGEGTKLPEGGQCLQDKIAKGIHYFVFYYIFIKKCFENFPGGSYITPPPPCTSATGY